MKEARLIVDHAGCKRKLCKLFFTKKDSSIYLQPYWPGNSFFSGSQTYAPGQEEVTFNFTGGLETSTCPKLSYHESGQAHLKVDNKVVATVNADPINGFIGGEAHIFTLLIDNLANLPLLETDLRRSKTKRDFICIAQNPRPSAKVLIYALSGQARYLKGCPLTIHLTRQSNCKVTTFGVRLVGNEQLGDGPMIVISGWNQRAVDIEEPGAFIYVASSPAAILSE